MKRKEVKAVVTGGGPRHLAPVETNVLEAFPNVVAHCSVTRYDDGSPRRPGWVMLKTSGPSWVVFVKDPDGACIMNLTAQTLDDALTLADLMLGSDDAPWEPDGHAEPQGKRKKN